MLKCRTSPQPLISGEVHVGVDVGASGGRVAAADLLQEQPADGRRRGPHVCHVGLQQQDRLGPQQEGTTANTQETHRGWAASAHTYRDDGVGLLRQKKKDSKLSFCVHFQRRVVWRVRGWCVMTPYKHRGRCRLLSSPRQSSERTDQLNTCQTPTQNPDQRTTLYTSQCIHIQYSILHTHSLHIEL